MKLFLIISVIAYSYAEKLDNTYLPPANAATAGGAPGSLTAPGAQTGPGLSNTPSLFGQPSGTAFGQPSGPAFGQGSSQTGPQAGSVQPGQLAIGQYTPQQYGQTGVLTQAGIPDYNQGSVGDNQAGTAPVAGSPGIGQGSPGYNQPGTLAGSSRPDFGQASVGYNQAPAFGGQAQIPSIYSGQPQPERARASIDRNAEILRYDNQHNGDSYAYSFETSNGISAEESGVATNGVRAQGSFAYTGDDGQQYRVTYTADENGYVPQGDHLPTPPPIPEEILKSLEENARAAAAGTQEGAYNPNEDSEEGLAQQSNGIYTGQGQPGQSGAGYNPSQGSAAGTGQQGFQNQGPVSQYGAGSSRLPEAQAGSGSSSNAPYGASRQPVSGSVGYSGPQGSQSLDGQYGAPGYQGNSAQGNQFPTSQYNAAGVAPSGISSASRPNFSTQNSKTDAIKYGSSISSPSGSVMPEQQGLNPNSGYQYNTPGSSSRPGQFQPQASQIAFGQNPTAQYNRPRIENISVQGRPTTVSQYGTPSGSPGTFRPGSQTPTDGAGSDSLAARPNQSTYNYNGLNTSPQTGGSLTPSFPSQGNQNSGYNYNVPTGSPSFRPLGTGTLNRPQGFSPQTNQVQSSQNIPQGTQALQLQGGQSPSTQYGGRAPSSSSPIRPTGSQENQFSQYGGSSPTSSNLQQTQSGLNQRPQLGNSGQKQDDGYQYNRPQSQFNTPSQTGIKPSGGPSGSSNNFNQFNRPSPGTTSSTPIQGTTAFSGNIYAPSGSISAGPTTAPNVFGSPKPSGSINQGYPSGPISSGSSSSGPVLIGQGANMPRPGQYPSSGPTNTAFSRPAIAAAYEPTSQYQTGQNSGSGSTSVGSAPYQYNRPGTQGPSSSAALTPFGSQPVSGSTSLGQNNSGRVESQPSFGVSAQDRPSQTGSQSGFRPSKQERPSQISSQSGYRPSGQERPAENFGGPRQPPSFSPEEGYKY